MNEIKKYYTLKIESNLYDDIFFNESASVTLDENKKAAFGEDIKEKLENNTRVKEHIIKELEPKKDFETAINELKIKLIFTEVDIDDYPRDVKGWGRYYAKPFTKEEKQRQLEEEIQELKEEIEGIDNQIQDLENEKTDLECCIDDIKILLKVELK